MIVNISEAKTNLSKLVDMAFHGNEKIRYELESPANEVFLNAFIKEQLW